MNSRRAVSSRDTLAEAVNRYGLSAETESFFRRVCEAVKREPQAELSKKESRAEIEALLLATGDVVSRLGGLSTKNLLWLNECLAQQGAPLSARGEHLSGHFDFITEVLGLLLRAAGDASDRHPDGIEIAKGGRPKTSSRAVSLVAVIARHLKDYGIAPTKSEGKFMSVCRGCFELAFEGRVPPDSAVKAFLADWRADYRAQGYCL